MDKVLGVIQKDKLKSKEDGYGFKLNMGDYLTTFNVDMDTER